MGLPRVEKRLDTGEGVTYLSIRIIGPARKGRRIKFVEKATEDGDVIRIGDYADSSAEHEERETSAGLASERSAPLALPSPPPAESGVSEEKDVSNRDVVLSEGEESDFEDKERYEPE